MCRNLHPNVFAVHSVLRLQMCPWCCSHGPFYKATAARLWLLESENSGLYPTRRKKQKTKPLEITERHRCCGRRWSESSACRPTEALLQTQQCNTIWNAIRWVNSDNMQLVICFFICIYLFLYYSVSQGGQLLRNLFPIIMIINIYL